MAEATNCIGQHGEGGDSIFTSSCQRFSMEFESQFSIKEYAKPFDGGCWGDSSCLSVLIAKSDEGGGVVCSAFGIVHDFSFRGVWG